MNSKDIKIQFCLIFVVFYLFLVKTYKKCR